MKSFADVHAYQQALSQAAAYAQSLGLSSITLAVFVDYITDAVREKLECKSTVAQYQVEVYPVFIATSTEEEFNRIP